MVASGRHGPDAVNAEAAGTAAPLRQVLLAGADPLGAPPRRRSVASTLTESWIPAIDATIARALAALAGSAEELAEAFYGYEQAGAAHLILNPTPYGLPALERLAEAIRLYRGKPSQV